MNDSTPVDDDLPDFDVIPLDVLEAAPVPPAGASGRPLWILRGDRVPEKVEARGKRRKVEIPADATHWCHEGDPGWIPFYRARPDEAAPARRVGREP